MARTPTAKPPTSKNTGALSLKISLNGIKPPIWRRVIVPAKMTLAQLHHVIQTAMGWGNCHLHVFEIGGEEYGDPSQMSEYQSEAGLSLQKLQKAGIMRFGYTYDFGDSWEHTITIEKAVALPQGDARPVCVAGKRACPPEDCGGPWGYAELLDILANPDHPEHEERQEWAGAINPEAFSIETINSIFTTN